MDHQTHRAASALISAVAWIFIVLAGFAILVCAAEYIVVAKSFPFGTRWLVQGDQSGEFGLYILDHLQSLLSAMLLMFVITLGAAIGLLKRVNGARVVFVGLMLFGIFWNLAGGVLTYYFLPAASNSDGSGTQVAPSDVLRHIVLTFNFLLSIASVALFSWIIHRLVSAEVRREFQPSDD